MSTSRRARHGSTDGKAPRRKDPLAGARDHYDLLVIGSGLAGLTAANILGRGGFSVALIEQHYNLGGLATWFKRRGGHVFDVSLHGFPVGMKKTCRKYWNRTIADSIVQLESIRFDNPQFSFETDFTREDFTRHLVMTFGLERETVESFFDHLRAMNFYDDSGETVGELFEQFFPGRNDVHRLLMEPISYANGSTLDDPAISYGIVFSNFMSKGVFTFSGGTDLLIREMKAELARNGVDLFHSVQVERILVEQGRVTGVEAGGRVIGADAVLSNASIKSTVEDLVGTEHFASEFSSGVKAIRLSNSSCQVYLGLRRGASIPFVTDLLFTSTRASFDSAALCDFHGESRTFSFYYPKTRPSQDRYTVVSSTNANHTDWANLSPEAYAIEKERLVADTIDHLERYLPGVREKIEHVEASTPRTFGFYTQHPAGASFGTKFEGLSYSMGLSDEVAGLFHAGSVGIIMSGWLGAANYGAIASNKVDAHLRQLAEITV
ncbi:MAG: FAD-dependent oxidoreductase [Planctomycetota bacterium]|nr:FAD-dependent oxidoreductase [Planctomycetota bacterium]